MIQWRRSSLQPSFLHKQKVFAERVVPCREVFTWKSMAIPEAVIDTVQDGACQDRAGSPEDFFLGTQFFSATFFSLLKYFIILLNSDPAAITRLISHKRGGPGFSGLDQTHLGNVKIKFIHSPGWDSARMDPPCFLMISFVMKRPSPVLRYPFTSSPSRTKR